MGVEWERNLHQAGSKSGLVVSTDALLVHERHTRLVRIDPLDGSVRWDVHVGPFPRAITVVGRRCLVLPQNTGQLLCLDMVTGERMWSTDLDRFIGHLLATEDAILVGGWRGYTPLRVLDMVTGQLRWETDDLVHTVRPAIAGDSFLIGEPGSSTVALIDRHEFRKISSLSLPQPLVDHDDRAAFTPTENHRFRVRCGLRSVVEIQPLTEIAREFVVADRDLGSSAPVHAGGVIWMRDRQSGFAVADSHDGHVLPNVDLPQPPVDQVVAVGAGFVVAGTFGTLFYLDIDGHVIAKETVSRRIRSLHRLGSERVLVMTKGTLLAAQINSHASQIMLS